MELCEEKTEIRIMVSAKQSEGFCETESPTASSWSWTQTMNYVGQLAGQMFVQVKELYRGLNPATLSGCIDVIVVQRADGSFQCSPFHVRFGKIGVLRSREKVVDIEINGEPVDLHMKLGENGEAFFVKEAENDQVVPSYLATSPILTDGAALMEAQRGTGLARHSESGSPVHGLGPSQMTGENETLKKRRRRRRKTKADTMKREDNGKYSEDEDMFTLDLSSDEETEPNNDRALMRDVHTEPGRMGDLPNSTFKQSTAYLRPKGDSFPLQGKTVEHKHQTCPLPIPISEGLSASCPPQSSLFQPPNSDSWSSTPKSDSELVTKPSDKDKRDNPEMLWTWGELPHAARLSLVPVEAEVQTPAPPVSVPVSESTHFRAISGEFAPEHPPFVPSMPEASGHEAVGQEGEGTVAAPHPLSELDEVGDSQVSWPVSKIDSPSKKKDKRSRHLGADGVYLDDITELEPEVAALYFPKNDGGGAVRSGSECGARSASHSPQSVSSSGMDSGVDSYSDQIGDLPSVAISLCGGLTDNIEITQEQFQEKAVSYHQFAENPALIDDPNLVVKIGTKYYNWTTAAPLMLAMQAFQKPLPKATEENIMKEKMPRKGGRWWFSWRGRSSGSKSDTSAEHVSEDREQPGSSDPIHRHKDESSSSDEEHQGAKSNPCSIQPEALLPPGGTCYKKTLRLSSEQLRSLQLKEGPNDVVFSVTTQYQGTCRCEGTIYLWRWDDKIIVSDIDGTITRSDTLGHILPTLGKDWTHQGIARLYHNVSLNGYKFVYCSARAIGMADMTRGYLHWVKERGTMLPQGPVLLSPSSLFSALHREVIEKKPEKFKIECLTDIKNLFHPNTEPFYAAFGNRATDVYAYKEVGVPLNRIFTVNPKGELIQEHAKTNISSYGRLCDGVDHVFPPISDGKFSDPSFSDPFGQVGHSAEQEMQCPAQCTGDNPDPHTEAI
ncbi:phosphatidate phosphatase LPIN1 isoform X2 [Paramormyrops kingsleyae]|uniref:phosphatidate phosphatase LPIN1 isoform X2 n=1 Tax=Paramormyrops kingsleyae TaxID=1676925 RepID=UPI003B97483F